MLDRRLHSPRKGRKGTQMSNRKRADAPEEAFSMRSHVSLAGSHFLSQRFCQSRAIQGHRQVINYGFSLPGLQDWVYAVIFLRPIWLSVNRNVFNIGIFSSLKSRVIYWLYWLRSCLYWQECNLSHWSHLCGSSTVLVEAKIFVGLPQPIFICQQCLSSKTLYLNSMRWI